MLRHGSAIDLAGVRTAVREFALALDEPERIDAFEALVARTLDEWAAGKRVAPTAGRRAALKEWSNGRRN